MGKPSRHLLKIARPCALSRFRALAYSALTALAPDPMFFVAFLAILDYF